MTAARLAQKDAVGGEQECGSRGRAPTPRARASGPSNYRLASQQPASSVRNAQAAQGVATQDSEKIEARECSVDLKAQDSASA